jgi:16S rRNA A1518/A1519 N6-dimethyltransferase RsmA/KsgA/DIM1 with predicted DNA glycosylase/AP lyase activity
VESALVSFKLRSEPLCDIDTAVTVSWLVRTLFNQRRKQMGKVLGNMIGKAVAAAAMAEVNLPLEVRPDKLPVSKFVELARAIMPHLDNLQK